MQIPLSAAWASAARLKNRSRSSGGSMSSFLLSAMAFSRVLVGLRGLQAEFSQGFKDSDENVFQ